MSNSLLSVALKLMMNNDSGTEENIEPPIFCIVDTCSSEKRCTVHFLPYGNDSRNGINVHIHTNPTSGGKTYAMRYADRMLMDLYTDTDLKDFNIDELGFFLSAWIISQRKNVNIVTYCNEEQYNILVDTLPSYLKSQITVLKNEFVELIASICKYNIPSNLIEKSANNKMEILQNLWKRFDEEYKRY